MNQSDEVIVDMFNFPSHVVDEEGAEDIVWSAKGGFTYNLALLVGILIIMGAIVVSSFFFHIVFN
tara:strand:+ start:306 stop:500 length:195 start_codon:yes stop_codon:yes gene_type:complete